MPIARVVAVVLVGSVVAGSALAQSIQVVSSTNDLHALAHATWTNTQDLQIMPPGVGCIRHSIGVLAYDNAFDAAFLSQLIAVTNGGIPRFPVQAIETNTSPRSRIWLNATGTLVQTTDIPAGYDWMQVARSAYGQPPPWLSGAELDQWYADRAPDRIRVVADLISTSDVPAYLAMLTNSIGSGWDGTTNIPLLTLYSNDLAFVKIERTTGVVHAWVHAPASVSRIETYGSGNLLIPDGWTMISTLNHSTDPLYWSYPWADELAILAAGNPAIDTDSDGLSDARELLLYGTLAEVGDTDGDGLSDGAEINTYGLNANNADSDGDGMEDGWEVANGLNPLNAADAGQDADGDGIPNGIERIIGTNPQVADPVHDVAPGEAALESRYMEANRSFIGVQGFGSETQYYRTASFEHQFYEETTGSSCVATILIKDRFVQTGTVAFDNLARTANTQSQYTQRVENVSYIDCTCRGGSEYRMRQDGPITVYFSYGDTNGCTVEEGEAAWTSSSTNTSCVLNLNQIWPDFDYTAMSPTHMTYSNAWTYTYGNDPDYMYGASGYEVCWVKLTNEYTPAELEAEARADLAALRSAGWESLGWGTNRYRDVSAMPDLCTAETGSIEEVEHGGGYGHHTAVLDMSVLTGDVVVRAAQNRVRVEETTTGIVYRATLVQFYTPEGASTSVVVYVTNLWAKGSGGPVVLWPTNGVTVEPPEADGVVGPSVLMVGLTHLSMVLPSPQAVLTLGYDRWFSAYEISPVSFTADDAWLEIRGANGVVVYKDDMIDRTGGTHGHNWYGTWNQGSMDGRYVAPSNSPYRVNIFMECEGLVSASNFKSVDVEALAFAGRRLFGWSDSHIEGIAAALESMSYQTETDQSVSEANAIAAAPDRLVWYTLSHGLVDSNNFFKALDYGDEFFPADVPLGVDYRLVFLNGCCSAQLGSGSNAEPFKNAFDADVYIGWKNTISSSIAAGFASEFFAHLDGNKTISQAISDALSTYTPGGFSYNEIVSNIRVIGNPDLIVDLSP
jgi:hypothetical protein